MSLFWSLLATFSLFSAPFGHFYAKPRPGCLLFQPKSGNYLFRQVPPRGGTVLQNQAAVARGFGKRRKRAEKCGFLVFSSLSGTFSPLFCKFPLQPPFPGNLTTLFPFSPLFRAFPLHLGPRRSCSRAGPQGPARNPQLQAAKGSGPRGESPEVSKVSKCQKRGSFWPSRRRSRGGPSGGRR